MSSLLNKTFAAHSLKHNKTQIYRCVKIDDNGLHMTNIVDDDDTRHISERALYRTFHEAEPRDNSWYVPYWCVSVEEK